MLKENGFRLACIVPGFLKESNKGPKKKSWEVVIVLVGRVVGEVIRKQKWMIHNDHSSPIYKAHNEAVCAQVS